MGAATGSTQQRLALAPRGGFGLAQRGQAGAGLFHRRPAGDGIGQFGQRAMCAT